MSTPAASSTSSIHTPPEWSCRPPISVQYKLRRVSDGSGNPEKAPAWDVVERAEPSFVSFGREPPVDFWISHDSVSRKHAVLQYGNGSDGPGWYIFDLGSSHGTFVNDEKIPAKEYVFVEDGSTVRLGFAAKHKFTLVSTVVKVDDGSEKLKIAYNPPNWRQAVPDELKYTLEVIDGGSLVEEIALSDLLVADETGSPKTHVTIGAFPEVSEVKDNHPSISRLHAVLQFGLLGKKYGWFLYDNASTHGTKLNRARLTARYYAKVPVGGSFKLGLSKKVFVLNLPDPDKEDEFAKAALAKVSVQPSAANPAPKSEVSAYTADPIGWLTSHFESEGLSLEYSFTPAGDKKTICSIDIRDAVEVDDPIVRGEGVGRDEAKKNAAFLACQIIDSNSTNAYSGSDFRTKRQEYEENDFYGSDEDEFYDRTGQLEERRKKRKNRIQNVEEEKKTLTYNDLVTQLATAKEALEAITISHEKISEEARITKSLNAKFVLSNSRQKLYTAQTDVKRLERLVAATRPADINKAFAKSVEQTKQPVVEKVEAVSEATPSIDDSAAMPPPPLPIRREKRPADATKSEPTKSPEASSEEPFEKPTTTSTDTVHTESTDAPAPEPVNDEKAALKAQGYGLVQREELRALKNNEITAKRRRIMESEEAAFEEKPTSTRDAEKEVKAAPEDDAVWLPPSGQTGDGTTFLNAKLGY
uniref:FHA domain-containing protein n=1 Tax=Panagrellus redivivus TaxID=6233 RepID=A0A7E4VY52_PANRE